MSDKYIYSDMLIHPGDHLGETLETLKISQTDLAERTGLSRKTINEIITGKAPITSDTAILLERVLNIPAHFWTNLQTNYNLNKAYLDEQEKLKEDIKTLKKLPIREMRRYKWIEKSVNDFDTLRHCYNFFGVASLRYISKNIPAYSYYRMSRKLKPSDYSVVSWLKAGERTVRQIHTSAFEMEGLKQAIPDLRKLTLKEPEIFSKHLVNICSKVGLAVGFVPDLPKTYIHGATFWLNNEVPSVLLSLRYKTNDQLWFTFFHELGHIVLHNRKDTFLEYVNQLEDKKEDEANNFAADTLIPDNEWETFINETRIYSHSAVKLFAQHIGIAPGIVVGRLQKEEYIPYSHLNSLKERFEWKLDSDLETY